MIVFFAFLLFIGYKLFFMGFIRLHVLNDLLGQLYKQFICSDLNHQRRLTGAPTMEEESEGRRKERSLRVTEPTCQKP